MKDKQDVKFSPDQLVSSTQLVKGFSKRLNGALKKPLFIQRDQKVQWVLMSLKEYAKIIEKEEHNGK